MTEIHIECAPNDEELSAAAKTLLALCVEKNITVASAESCTGGMIGKVITDIPGSSAVFVGGMMTYTNDVKIRSLGVDAHLIDAYTEVSAPVAAQMAEKICEKLHAVCGVSATGYAGPGGGSERDPVGTVYIGVAKEGEVQTARMSAPPDASRDDVRRMATAVALQRLTALVDGDKKNKL